jgi:glycosyltransferase involved in cell wall biosynthesis
MISSEYPPHVLGGLGVHVNQLTKELAAFVDIDLVLPHQKIDYAEPPNPPLPTPSRIRIRPLTTVEASYDEPFSWLLFSQQAFSLIENIYPKPAKPAVIHCHDWVTVLCGIKCRWALNVPLIFHVHLPNRTPFCSSVENLGLACADLVTVNSQAMCEQLHKRFPDRKIKVIPNGVDITIFKEKPEVLPETEVPNNHAEGQYVLFVGRLVEQKGVDYLLRAFVHVRERFPAVKLKIVGNGPCNLAYVRLADCLLIKDAVEFLGWTDSSSELSRLYQGASIVVVPSIYEPFGMTALEAMACARPVIASKTGGLQEFIKHGVTGYLAEPKDYLDLAQWIIRLLDNKKLRQDLGKMAGQTVTEDNSAYRWTSVAQQFHLIYEELARQDVNLNVPEQANDYVQQIRSLSTGNDQTILDNLFIRGRQ